MENTLFTAEDQNTFRAVLKRNIKWKFHQITESVQIVAEDARDAVEKLQVMFPGEYERDDHFSDLLHLEVWYGTSREFGSFTIEEEWDRTVKISFKDFGEYTVKILH